MKYSKEDLQSELIRTIQREKPFWALLSIFGSFFTCIYLLSYVPNHFFLELFLIAIVLPIVVGLIARLIGGLHLVVSRIPLTLLFGLLFVLTGLDRAASFFWFLATPFAMAFVFSASRKSLSSIQEFAVLQHAVEPFDVNVRSQFR